MESIAIVPSEQRGLEACFAQDVVRSQEKPSKDPATDMIIKVVNVMNRASLSCI
jgi:hypothetical protein